jgi:hypothetical protein
MYAGCAASRGLSAATALCALNPPRAHAGGCRNKVKTPPTPLSHAAFLHPTSPPSAYKVGDHMLQFHINI